MQVNPQTATMNSVGETVQFKALGTYLTGSSSGVQDVTNQVTWASSDPNVGTINSSGLATAVAGGSTTITASMESSAGTLVAASASLTVSASAVARDLTSITIVPSSQNVLTIGEPIQFTAIGNYSASPTSLDLTGQVTWKSSDVSVASINPAGLAIGNSTGTATIIASATAKSAAIISGTATVTVSPTAVARGLTSITIIPSSQSVVSVGEPTQFIAIGNYNGSPTTQDLTTQATWRSSDVNVATINSAGQPQPGLASAVNGGTTTITASFTGNSGAVVTGIATLSVSANAVVRDLTSITIIPSSQVVQAIPGESAQYVAIGSYSGTPTTVDLTHVVTWQSSDLAVGTINSNGYATANNLGVVTITASALSNSGNIIIGSATFQVQANAGNGSILPTLTVYEVGFGSGRVDGNPAPPSPPPGEIACTRSTDSTACTGYYPLGTIVTLTATPDAGSSFGGWSANCTPITATSCQIVMNNNQPVGVIFNKP
jgi:hypothetical protein